MTQELPGRGPAAGLLVSCAASAAALPAFLLLYLSVPTGHSPYGGFADKIGPAYGSAFAALRLELSPRLFSGLACLLLAVMWIGYLAALAFGWRLAQAGQGRFVARVVGATFVTGAVALVLVPPTLSTDLFHYALFGRMVVERGLNPYVTPANALRGDPLFAYASWQQLTTHYGPVFTWFSAGAAWLGAGSVPGTALVWKALTAAAGVACLGAVRRLTAGHAAGLVLLAALALNPVFLIETAGNAHNEAVMMAPALWGYWLVRQGRTRWGVVLLTLSVHVKWVSAALLVFAFLEVVRAQPRRWAALAVEWFALVAAVSVALYAPFWAGPSTFGTTFDLVWRGQRLDGAAQGGLRWGWAAAFALVFAAAAVVVWRSGGRRTLEASAAVILAFVFLVFDWWYPWPTISALLCAGGTAPDRRSRYLLGAIVWLGPMLMLRWAVLVRIG